MQNGPLPQNAFVIGNAVLKHTRTRADVRWTDLFKTFTHIYNVGEKTIYQILSLQIEAFFSHRVHRQTSSI